MNDFEGKDGAEVNREYDAINSSLLLLDSNVDSYKDMHDVPILSSTEASSPTHRIDQESPFS